MNRCAVSCCTVAAILLAGCARLEFSTLPTQQEEAREIGLLYYDPKPYLFVTTTGDCATTAVVLIMPGTKREVRFHSGLGSAELNVDLSNGMITSVGQKTDTKIPETFDKLASLSTTLGLKVARVPGKQVICDPSAKLYPIENGSVGTEPVSMPVKWSIVDSGATQ